ncbi:MAG: GIY-YIG nuclease family protein [Saprospiraceae bacterium]|nr:GIY-YIG nuclease family protein [Saprospiraceae bacterium]
MMCHTYIIFSPNLNRHYIGLTCDDLKGRLRRHNSNHEGFTGRATDWEYVFSEAFSRR